MTIEKLPFQVVNASGWEDDHHPSSLHIQNHQPTTYGWHSQRFCTFPQTLILRLAPGKSRLRKVQLLSHHFMVAKRIDLFIGNLIPQKTADKNHESETVLNQIHFNRLGYVTLDDNERTQYKARELKSIHVDVFGEFIKIVLDKCHINPLNLYNQVGLVAVNVLGEVPDDFMFQSLDQRSNMNPTPIHAPMQELSFEMFHDPTTSKWIRAAERAKERAVLDENFPLAKSLKMLMEVLKQTGEEMAKMEMAKKRAIHEEDFDSALNLKEEIQKLRQALLQKMSNDGFAIDSSGEIVLRQRITPGGNLMAAVQQQSAPPAAVVAPASTEHASPPTTSVLLSGGAGQADKAGASPTTRNESNPDLHFATTTNWEENASVGEIRSSSPAATVRAGNFSVDASQNALGQNSAAITMDRVGGEQSPKASQSVDTGLSAPPLRLAPAAVALAEDPAPSSKRGSSIDVKKQPAIAEKSTPPASPKKSPKQQRLAAPQDALDRPIKVKPAAFDIDAFDENSTPPGLAPSQNEKSGVIAAPKRPAAKQTKTAAEEEATSSSPSPAKAKKAAPVAQDERPIKVKAVQYDSIEFDETSTPPGLEPPRQVAVKGAAKRAPKAKPDDASPAAARSPVMKVAKKKVDDEEQVRSPAPAKGARAARGKAAEEKSAVKRHARSTVSTGNPFSDHRTSDFEIEELSGMDRTEFFDSIFLFGDNVVACLVGKQFAAREWALTEVAQVLSEAAVYVTKNDDAVDPVVVVHGVYAVITKGMLDTREKIVSLAIQAWQNMLDYSTAANITHAMVSRSIDPLVPVLLTKIGDPNPRMREAAQSFLVTLVNTYDDHILKHVFAPIPLTGKPTVPPKIIKARIEAATYVTIEGTPAPADLETTLLPFVVPLLGHSASDIREGASKLVVAWYTRLFKERGDHRTARTQILSRLASLEKPQLIESLKRSFEKISGSDKGPPPAAAKSSAQPKKKSSVGPLEDDEDMGGEQEDEPAPLPSKKMANASPKLHPVQSKGQAAGNSTPSPTKNASPSPNAKRAASKSPARKADAEAMSNDWNIDKTCIFCNETNDMFDEERLDMHYWHDCPMLAQCAKCNQIVEVSMLNAHYLHDCDQKEDMKKCPKCRQAVVISEFAEHKDGCKGLAKGQQYCPLCSDIIEDGPESWRQHLAITKCPQNPRTRKRSKLPQFAKRTGATGVKSNLPTAVSPTKLPKITTASNVQSPQNQRKGSQLSPAMTRLKQAPMSPPLATTMPTVKTVGGTTSAPTKKSGFFGFGKK